MKLKEYMKLPVFDGKLARTCRLYSNASVGGIAYVIKPRFSKHGGEAPLYEEPIDFTLFPFTIEMCVIT